MPIFELSQASSPLVISVPHDGGLIPAEIQANMTNAVDNNSDRDYLIGQVFDFPGLSYSKIKANYSRHVVDLNRPVSGEALYANQAETELCPTTTFGRQDLYLPGKQPNQQEIERRIAAYWQPYHNQLAALIAAAKDQFGYCLLIDAHSIDDQVPRFFDGSLPDINVGTFAGKSCAPKIEHALLDALREQSTFTHVANGRFKGGFITRHYGNPADQVHAIQLEHAKSSYLDEQNKISSQAEQLRLFWRQTLLRLYSASDI